MSGKFNTQLVDQGQMSRGYLTPFAFTNGGPTGADGRKWLGPQIPGDRSGKYIIHNFEEESLNFLLKPHTDAH